MFLKNPSILLTICLLIPFALFAQDKGTVILQQLSKTHQLKVNIHTATQVPRFIRFSKDRPLKLSGNTATEKANAFFQQYGEIWGIHNPNSELKLRKQEKDFTGA